MKNLLAVLLLALLTLSFSCQSGKETESKDTTEMGGDNMDGASSTDMASNAAYTVTVTKPDIPSPRKIMKGSIGNAMISIDYGSPSVKGRNLWGGLVPYDQVWRAGANEATKFEVSSDIMVGGKTLPTGTYGFFLYPKEDGPWEVIFNEVADQWGAYDYDNSKDKIRVTATPTMVEESSETMDFMIEGNNVVLRWGKLKLSIPFSA